MEVREVSEVLGFCCRERAQGVPRGEMELRPDGYLAWAPSGRTQQRVEPVRWKEESFRAGSFELGRFYSGRSGVFRLLDNRLREVDGGGLAEVYDANLVGRMLDGAVVYIPPT